METLVLDYLLFLFLIHLTLLPVGALIAVVLLAARDFSRAARDIDWDDPYIRSIVASADRRCESSYNHPQTRAEAHKRWANWDVIRSVHEPDYPQSRAQAFVQWARNHRH